MTRALWALLGIAFAAADLQMVHAATLTVRNNCGYTVYPGIYPPVYQNGGWSQGAGATVSFTISNTFTGRVWGRTGCNSASPAQCATGSCGGTGLQCAGTTGFPNTSLFEINVDASGTDWYNISYVDAVDNPLGLAVSNGSCYSPNTCNSAVKTNCPAGLRSGSACLSPCTRYNTDQFCCRGAFGTQATCVVANWSAEARTYVDNIHAYCPRQYSYAYDEGSGALHTCGTGANYTLTFCPGGSAPPPPPPPGEIIVDNGTGSFSTGGTWVASSSTPGYYGSNYLHDGGAGTETGKWAKWKPTFPATASYTVYARWTAASNRPASVKYRVYHQGAVTDVWKNQQVSGGSWQSLGTFTFSGGNSDSNRVTLDAGSASGYVIADAVRFVRN